MWDLLTLGVLAFLHAEDLHVNLAFSGIWLWKIPVWDAASQCRKYWVGWTNIVSKCNMLTHTVPSFLNIKQLGICWSADGRRLGSDPTKHGLEPVWEHALWRYWQQRNLISLPTLHLQNAIWQCCSSLLEELHSLLLITCETIRGVLGLICEAF